jgi:hypothetical protein
MKLIYCPICKDILRLHVSNHQRPCLCGRSWGRYRNPSSAEIGGKAIPLGIRTLSFMRSVDLRPDSGDGIPIDAFVFAKKVDSISTTQTLPPAE